MATDEYILDWYVERSPNVTLDNWWDNPEDIIDVYRKLKKKKRK